MTSDETTATLTGSPVPPETSRVRDGCLLRMTSATSRQDLLDQLLQDVTGLKGLVVWAGDRGEIMLTTAGEHHNAPAGSALSLCDEPAYWLSVIPDMTLSREVLAVLELKFLYFDVQDSTLTLEDQLEVMQAAARTDPLTGLPNRHALEADLRHLEASVHPYALLVIDLDGFKAINDRYGHALGDGLLKGYGLWLTRVAGRWGRVYRIGGDEYLLLLTRFPTLPEQVQAWADECLQVPFVDGVSASMGLAWRHEGSAYREVIDLADQRMFRSKAQRSRSRR